MSTLYIGLTIMLVFVSLAIIALVLLQKGKGAEAGAAFGAGASGTVFGAQGSANFLSRATAVLAAVFFFNCLALAYLSAQRPEVESLLQDSSSVPDDASLVPDGDDVDPLDLPSIDEASEAVTETVDNTGAGLEDAAVPADSELPDISEAELPDINENGETGD